MAEQTYRLLKISEVETVTGKSRSSIYGDPTFPKPLKIGVRSSAWLESEVNAWIESRIEARQTA